MQVINATEEHLSFLADMEARVFSDAWSGGALASHLLSPTSRTLLALSEEGHPIGYLLGSVIFPEGEVYRVAALPEARRMGVASALLCAFLREIPVCFLEVREGNASARALYEKHGFSLIGERKNYYKDPKENACIYKKEAK